MKRFALLALLGLALAGCGDVAPAPPRPASAPTPQKLPSGCIWVAMQGQGKDSNSGDTWVFAWQQPVCGQVTPAPGAAYEPGAEQAQQQAAWVNTWLILRASGTHGGATSGGDEGGGDSGGDDGGGESGGGGDGGR